MVGNGNPSLFASIAFSTEHRAPKVNQEHFNPDDEGMTE